MKPIRTALGAASLLVVAAEASAAEVVAVARLQGAKGGEVGTVELRETPSGLARLTLTASGLPVGERGFHIHETGACDAADGFKSAGGHLAGGHQHGVLNPQGPHVGDLPNIHVPEGGRIVFEAFLAGAAPGESWSEKVGLFDGDGSAVIIHAGADDYTSQPTGEAGDRVACGVLEKQ